MIGAGPTRAELDEAARSARARSQLPPLQYSRALDAPRGQRAMVVAGWVVIVVSAGVAIWAIWQQLRGPS